MNDENTSIVGQSAAHESSVQKLSSIKALGEAVINIANALDGHESRIANLEDTARVNGIQENKLTTEVNKTIVNLLGGKKSNAYADGSLRGRAYAEINKEIKNKFGIPRRSELPRVDYQKAMRLIKNWIPSDELRREIKTTNNQLTII